MAGELSGVLDHIEKIGELGDLEDVAADLARRRGRERAARRRAAAVAAARGRARERARRRRTTASASRARAPRPHERAARADRRPGRRAACARGDLDPGELWTAYRERALADELNAFSWVADEVTAARGRARRAARRRPARGQGPVLHRGHPEPGRLEDPRGLPAAVHGDRGRAPRRRRRAAARQDQPGRVRDGLVDRELAPTARCSTRGTARACPAARAAAAPPRSRPARRRGRSAPTPAARSASPPRCAGSSASSRPTARSRRYGMIAFASSLDQAGPFTRDVTDCRAAVRRDGRPGPVRLDLARASPSRSALPSADRPATASASACPRSCRGEGIEPGVLDDVPARRSTLAARARRRDRRRCTLPHAPARAAPPTT